MGREVFTEVKETAINLLRSNEDLPVADAAKLAVKGFVDRNKGSELPAQATGGGFLATAALIAGVVLAMKG